jgi:hypothetical protein
VQNDSWRRRYTTIAKKGCGARAPHQDGVLTEMRFQSVKLLLLIGCVAALASARASGQQPDPEPGSVYTPLIGPPPVAPVQVIHNDLPKADEQPELEQHANRYWARADWLLAWIRGASFPPLVTVGATSQPLPGALGQDGTMIRFAGDPSTHEREGARFQLGGWFDDCQCFGLEVGGWFLGSRSVFYGMASPGTPAIARPFFNVISQQQDASLVTFPGLASGNIAIESGTRLFGTDANMLIKMNACPEWPIRLIAGLRHLDLHDDLNVDEVSLVAASSPVFPGQRIGVRDNFSCENSFFGGNLGFSAAYILRRLELQLTAQCAVGVCQEYVTAMGLTRFDGPAGSQTVPGGFLALSSNSGSHVRDAFAVVPEVDLEARFEITRHIVITAGYGFLYWSRVARAGQQVDLNINPNLVPTSSTFGQPGGPSQPQMSIRDTDFWMHGVHAGLEFRF